MFNAIVSFSLRQRLLVLVASALILLAGYFSLRQLPVDVFPDLNRPTVTIMTESAGMAPEEVETLVTFPIESAMQGMPGVTRVRSVSGVGLSVVYVEFEWGSESYRNRQQVAERLSLVSTALPAGVRAQMAPMASIMGEILLIGISAADATPMQLRDRAEFELRPRLLAIPGVAQVIPIGGELREWRVSPDPLRMHALDIELDSISLALTKFGQNTSGGFLDADGSEFLIRHQGRSRQIEDLQQLVIAHRDNHPILLSQVAQVSEAARAKRGDAGMNGKPAVILSVQKQPGADTLTLTKSIESQLLSFNAGDAEHTGVAKVLFRQASFIERAVSNVQLALRDGALMVALVLFAFLLSWRATVISLLAIPVSIAITLLAFSALDLSINTMTLGGIAIAVGELVDDAVVDVENIVRRLRTRLPGGDQAFDIVRDASIEVRSGIVYATLIVVLVFVPLFSLSGIEGRLFAPLGLAYIIAIIASLITSLSLTPVLSLLLLPKKMTDEKPEHVDGALVRYLKNRMQTILQWTFVHERQVFLLSAGALMAALLLMQTLPRSFLPPFNEGTLTLDMQLKPGIALTESNKIGQLAEQLLLQIPEVKGVGRRTGRAELDEHAEGVHYTEIDVDLQMQARDKEALLLAIRQKLSALPVAVNIGQPISHRLDHLLSGVRAEIAIKIFGDDLDTLRGLAQNLQQSLQSVTGLTDLRIEKQVRVPQITVQIDYQRAADAGVSTSAVLERLEELVGGVQLAELRDGNKRVALTLRVKDENRSVAGLRNMLVPARGGHVPLSTIADIVERDGPNQIGRDNGRRRIVISANTDGHNVSATAHAVQEILQKTVLPDGYSASMEGQFQAQQQASLRIGLLALVSLLLIFVVLQQRYQSHVLAVIIMANIPLALVGSVVALWLSGQPLSVASMIGFITLAGISTRNGILKISHYINLMAHEGELFCDAMIVRGSLERLVPVLMTALTAAFALIPLVLSSGESGKEILHPVAVVIFGGLLSSTLLDSVLTPLLFRRLGQKPAAALLAKRDAHDVF